MITLVVALGAIVLILAFVLLEYQSRQLDRMVQRHSNQSFEIITLMSQKARLQDQLAKERNRTLTRRLEAKAKVDDGAHIFAQRVVIDHDESQVYVDGVRLPWWIADPDGPTIEPGSHQQPLTRVVLPIWVDGTVEVVSDTELEVTDSVLGSVADYARREVQREMTAAFPWLEV